MQVLAMYGLCFGSVILGSMVAFPEATARVKNYLIGKSSAATTELGDMFLDVSPRTVMMVYGVLPVVFGLMGWMLTGIWALGLLGIGAGVIAPKMILAHMHRSRCSQFHNQLIDGLLMLTGSLKAGLSMTQAFNEVIEEMPPPISQEFGLVMKQIRMGVSLADGLGSLKSRMGGDDLDLFITAVLVSRETGGDIAFVFGRLIETLRDRKKLKEKIKTLTFMARAQGGLMILLPFVFAYLVWSMDHNYFDFFFQEALGRMMLFMIVMLQVIAILLFLRFGRLPT